MSWLTLTLPDQPETPPNYEDVAWEEEFSRHTSYLQPPGRGSHAILCLPSLRNQISDSASLFRGKFTFQRCRRDPACFLHSLNMFQKSLCSSSIQNVGSFPLPFWGIGREDQLKNITSRPKVEEVKKMQRKLSSWPAGLLHKFVMWSSVPFE